MAGIAFYINGEQLQLAPDQKISISMESPLLSDKTIPGAVSFPFNIAATSTNKRLLNISDTLMSFDEYQNVPCQCFLYGNFWKAGFIIINTHSAKTINITYTEFNSEEDFDDKTLQDIVFPVIDTSQKFYDRPSGTLSDFHNQLLVRALRWWGILGVTEKDFVCPTIFNVKTLDVAQSFGFQNLVSNGNYATGFYDEIIGNTISPCFFVNYLLKYLFKNFGIDVNLNKLKESDLDDLIVYTNRANLMTLLTPTNPSDNYDCYMDEPTMNLSEYVPATSLTDFLTGLKKSFNLCYLINWGNNKVDIICKNDVIKNNKIIDITKISDPFESMSYKSDYKVITCVLYSKKEDLIITDDTSRFSLKGYNYKGVVNSVSDIPNVVHQTFDYYIIPIHFYNTIDTHNIVYYDVNGNWVTLKPRIKDCRPYDVYFSNGKKENKLELGIDSIVTRHNTTKISAVDHDSGAFIISEADYYEYFCPAVDIGIATNVSHYPGDLEPGGKTDIDVVSGLHLLFYRGIRQEMKDGGNFPYAGRNEFDFIVSNPGVPDDDNNTVPAPDTQFFDAFDHSLEIDGPKGLWIKFHQDWQEFLSTLSRLATFNIRWSAAQLTNQSIFQNFFQINGNRFIISKVTITADVNTIYPCKTEMYQIQPV